jgi:hypothetical protein
MYGLSPLGWVHTLGSLPAIPQADICLLGVRSSGLAEGGVLSTFMNFQGFPLPCTRNPQS